MSHHNDPRNTPELLAMLRQHGLPNTTPSQVADGFRLGYWRAKESAQAEPARYGNRSITKMYAQINALRAAIRAEGTPAIQKAWDAVEEHIDFAYRPVSKEEKQQ